MPARRPPLPTTLWIAAVGIVIAGCGGADRQRQTGPDDSQHAKPDNGGTDVDPAAPLSAAECRRLTDHVIDLYLGEMKRTRPAEEIPTGEQVDEIRTKLGAELNASCLEFPRSVFDCGLAAKSFAAVAECQKVESE